MNMLRAEFIKTNSPALSRHTGLQHAAVTATAAFTAPMIALPAVFGAIDTVAPSHRITVGFIGMGREAMFANIFGFCARQTREAWRSATLS
jgi:hypothetical protein